MSGESDKLRSERRPGSMIGAGVAIGAGFGVALGLVLGNLALGIAIGIAIGVSLSERDGVGARREAVSRGTSLSLIIGLMSILVVVAAGIALLLIFGAG